MNIERNDTCKIIAVWLQRGETTESHPELEELYKQAKADKYTVAVFHSGDRDIVEETSQLLLYNRKRKAEREVAAESKRTRKSMAR